MKIKAYTKEFGLLVSKSFTTPVQGEDTIIDLYRLATPTKIYLSSAKGSTVIPLKTKGKRPAYYTRPDGTVTRTLSIHCVNYPMVCTYEDGTKERIGLS